jgi:hypothetical protein
MHSTNKEKEKTYKDISVAVNRVSGVAQVGLIAAVSALAGGLAVAWWHRKTLSKLQNPIILDTQLDARFLEMEERDPDSL